MAVGLWWLGVVLSSCLLVFTWADLGSAHLSNTWTRTSAIASFRSGEEYDVDVRDTGSGAIVKIFAYNASDGTPILDAELGAKLSPPDVYYPSIASDYVPGAYLISLYVSGLGSYSFRVLVCYGTRICKPVNDMVYEFNVAGKLSARKSFASGYMELYPVGQEATFNITAEDAHGVVETFIFDPIPFVVNVTSTVGGSPYFTPAIISPMGQGTYSVQFTPTRMQDYHVSVTLDGHSIFGGQWDFSTMQNELDDAAKFYLQPDHELGPSVVIVGPHTMSISCSEPSYVAINNFNVVISSATNNSDVIFSYFCSDSRLSVDCDFMLNVTHPGKYSILVTLGDTPIKNMPYYLTILPGMAMVAKSSIHSSMFKVRAGTSVSYDVTLVDIYGNPAASTFGNAPDSFQLIVELCNIDFDPLFAEITPIVDGNGAPVSGSFTAVFDVKLAGNYTVNGYFGPSSGLGQFSPTWLVGSGFELTVEPSTPFPAKSFLELSTNASVGSDMLAKLYIRDAYLNNIGMVAIAGNRLFLYVFTSTHNFSFPFSGVAEHFECVISGITRAQHYQVDVFLDGEIFLNGYELLLVGGPVSPRNCKIERPGHLTAGETGWFLLQLADKYGNNVTQGYDVWLMAEHLLHVRAVQDEVDADVHVTSASRSFWNVTISTTVAGVYSITFGWAHNRVDRLITVHPGRLNASQIVTSGPGIVGGVVGSNFTVFIAPRDTYGNELAVSEEDLELLEIQGTIRGFAEITSDSTPSEPTIYPVKLDKTLNLYAFNYSTLKAGVLRISVTAQNISSTFISVHKSGPLSVTNTCISGFGLHGTATNRSTTFYITARDKHGNPKNDPDSYAEPFRVQICKLGFCNVGNITVEDKHTWAGKYAVTYIPFSPGSHSIHVLWFGKDVCGSPAVVPVVDSSDSRSPDATKFIVCGGFPFVDSCPGLSGAVANQEATIILTAADENGIPLFVGGATLLLTIDPLPYSASVQDLDNGTYRVSYVINMIGNYSLLVKMDETVVLAQSIKVVPGATSAKNSKLEAQWPSACPVGTVISSMIIPVDDWSNKQVYGPAYPSTNDAFAIVAVAESGQVAAGKVYTAENGSLFVTLTSILAGKYNVSCTLNGKALAGITFLHKLDNPDVSAIPGAPGMIIEFYSGPPTNHTSEVFYERQTIAGALGIITLLLRDAFGNELNQGVNCSAVVTNHGSGLSVTGPSCQLVSPSIFELEYNITEAGLYNITFMVHDDSGYETEFVCDVTILPDRPSAKMSTVGGDGFTSSVAGSESMFAIVCLDNWNNNCSEELVRIFTVVLTMDSISPVFATLSVRNDSQDTSTQVVAKYTLMHRGIHSCKVTLGDQELAGSPFSVTSLPAPSSAQHSFAILQTFAGRLNTSLSSVILAAGHTGVLKVVIYDSCGYRQDKAIIDTLNVTFYPNPDFITGAAYSDPVDPGQLFASYDKRGNGDGTYDIVVSATAGTYLYTNYLLSVGLIGLNGVSYDISGSPFKYQIIPGEVNVAKSDVIQKESWADRYGLNWRLDLVPRDSFGNTGTFFPELNVSASLQFVDGLSSSKFENGRVAGLNVKQNERSEITPKITYFQSNSSVYSRYNSPGYAEFRDLELLNIGERLQNNVGPAPVVLDSGYGVYSVVFTVIMSGYYNISLFINGKLVGGPWVTIPNFQVDPGPVDLSRMSPSGQGLAENVTIAGQLSAISLYFNDKFGNMLSVPSSEAADYIHLFIAEFQVRVTQQNSFIYYKGNEAVDLKNMSTDDDGLIWLYYQPLKSGELFLDIFYSSDSTSIKVVGSPFSGTVIPGDVLPGNCVAEGAGLKSAIVCDSIACPNGTIMLEARDGLDNSESSEVSPGICSDFSVNADPSLVFSVPTAILGKCLLTYVAMKVSTQNVAIHFLGSPIARSPFEVVVRPTIVDTDPYRSIATGELGGLLVVGATARMTVQLRDTNGAALYFSPYSGTGYVSITIVNSTTESSPKTTVLDNDNGTYDLEFLAYSTGFYFFNIFIGVLQIPLGGNYRGYMFQVVSGPTSLNTTSIALVSNATAYRSGIDKIRVEVLPADAYGNAQDYLSGPPEIFEAQILQPDGATVYEPLTLISATTPLGVPYAAWILDMMPTQAAGEEAFYTFNFLWSNGSAEELVPLQISVLTTPGPPYVPNTKVIGQGASIAMAGVATAFIVVLYDEFNNPIVSFADIADMEVSFNLKLGFGSTQRNCTVVTSPVGASCSYVAQTSGKHTLELKIGDFGTKKFFDVLVGPGPIFTPFCQASGDGVGQGAPIYAGSLTRFVIDVYDILNNTIYDAGSSFTVLLETDNDDDISQIYLEPDPIYPLWTGTNYEVYYTPIRAGFSWLHVTRNHMNISGSPFHIEVLAGPVSVERSTVDQSSLESCISGQIHNITLHSRDSYGNARLFESDVFHITKAVDNGPEEWATAIMSPLGEGLYGFSYRCIRAGSNSANPNATHILIGFRELEVLNVHLPVLPGPVDITKCTVALLDRAITMSHVGSVIVVSKDSAGNRLWTGGLNFRVVLVLDHMNVTASVVDTMDGAYQFTYTHTVSGNHSLLVFLDDQLLHQDYVLVYPNSPDARSTKVTFHPKGYTSGVIGSCQVQLRDMFFNNVTSDVLIHSQLSLTSLSEDIPPSFAILATSINYTPEGYDVHFVPKFPGMVRVDLFISGQRVVDRFGVPYSAPVSTGAAAPSKFVLFGSGIESGAIANKAAIFFAQIKDSAGNIVTRWPSGIWAAAFSPASLVTSTPIIVQSRNGTARVSYIPTRPSHNMAVSLMYSGQRVGHTRYVKVKAQVGPWSVANSVAVDVDGVPVDKEVPVVGVAGTGLVITIQPRDADGIDIAEVPDPSTMTYSASVGGITVPVVPTSQGPFGIVVNFTTASRYVVEITSADGLQYIRNSGFVIFLVPGPADPASTLYLKSYPTVSELDYSLDSLVHRAQIFDGHESLKTGDEVIINVVACDKFGNERRFDQIYGDDVFSATVTHVPTSSMYNSFLTVDNHGGVHVLHLTPQYSGSYELSIFLNGIRAQTFSLDVKSSFIDYSQFTLLLLEDSSLEAGRSSVFELRSEDVFDVADIKGLLFVEFQQSDNSLLVQALVEPSANDTSFRVSALFTRAGLYDVIVTDASTKITGLGPASSVIATVEILAGPISNSTTTSDAFPMFARAGEQITVLVAGRDVYGNLNCSLPGLVLTEPVYSVLLVSHCAENSSVIGDQTHSSSAIFTPTLPGTVSISMIWNDTVVERSVEVLSVVPPQLVAAVMSNNLGTISVLFNQDTDCGYHRFGSNLTEANRCEAVLDALTLPKLGSRPSCVFKDPRTLLIALGNEASISPSDSMLGDLITIQDDTLLSADGTSYAVTGTVLLNQPRSPIIPVASLVGPTAVGPCDPLLLDASASSGSGGRKMHFTYTVQGSGDQDVVANLRVLLNNVSSEQFWVLLEPGTLEQGQSYQFTLSVVNFRGAAASSTITVRATSVPVPLLSIFGADQVRIARRSELIQIEAAATLPSPNFVDETGRCMSNISSANLIRSPALAFRWSQSAGPVLNLSSVMLNERVLSIPGDKFDVDKIYGFSVTCYFLGFPSSQSSAEITLAVNPSSILVYIVGGSRTVNSSENLIIEAAVLDPDESSDPYGLPYQAKYSWKIDPDLHGSFLRVDLGRRILLPAGVLSSGTYNISVTVDKEPYSSGRVGVTAWIIIQASPSKLIPVSLEWLDAAGFLGGNSPAKQVRLQCNAEIKNYTWSIRSETDRRTFFDTESESMGQETLLIPPRSLLGGSSYTILCSVQSGNVFGNATVSFRTWLDPSGGSVMLFRSPADGPDIAGRTLYTLLAYGWTPGEGIEQGALQYEFRYLLDNHTQTVVQPLSTVNSARDFIVEAGSVVFQVYVTNPGFINVTSEDAPQGSLYELPSINVMTSSSAPPKPSRRSLLSLDTSDELFLYNEIYTPLESQGQYYNALHVIEVFGSQFVVEGSRNCSHDPTLALIVNDMLKMIASTDPRYPPSYVSDTMTPGSGPYTALAVACAYSKILGDPGNVDEEQLHATLDIMVNKLQQVAMHRLNVPSISGQPYDPCFYDAVNALLNVVHAECTRTSGSLMDLASQMPLWLAQIVSSSLGFGLQSPAYVTRSSFSLISASLESFEGDAARGLSETVENFRFEITASPQFDGTIGAVAACFPSFAPLSGAEWGKANYYKDLLAVVDVCDFALSPGSGMTEVVSFKVSFVNLVSPKNSTFTILQFKDGALNFDTFEDSHYENGTVFLELTSGSPGFNSSSRFVLIQVANTATSRVAAGTTDVVMLLAVALLWLL